MDCRRRAFPRATQQTQDRETGAGSPKILPIISISSVAVRLVELDGLALLPSWPSPVRRHYLGPGEGKHLDQVRGELDEVGGNGTLGGEVHYGQEEGARNSPVGPDGAVLDLLPPGSRTSAPEAVFAAASYTRSTPSGLPRKGDLLLRLDPPEVAGVERDSSSVISSSLRRIATEY
jgi:hypothetical protein